MWNEETQRVIQPIRNYQSTVVGHIARYWAELDVHGLDSESRGCKSITYWENGDEPFMHAVPVQGAEYSGLIILVEDLVSACRVAQLASGVLAIGLLGVHFTADELSAVCHYVERFHTGNLGGAAAVVALDRDATVTGIKLARRIRGACPVTTVPLDNDIKDMTPDELHEFMEVVYGTAGHKRSSA